MGVEGSSGACLTAKMLPAAQWGESGRAGPGIQAPGGKATLSLPSGGAVCRPRQGHRMIHDSSTCPGERVGVLTQFLFSPRHALQGL